MIAPFRAKAFHILAALLILFIQAEGADARNRVDVIYAGSLISLMENGLGPAFKAATGIDYRGEACGSVTCAMLMKEGLKRPDLFISADSQVIENMLFGPANSNLAAWYIEFAAARLVIAYNPKSKFAPALEEARKGGTAWYKVLLKDGFKFGITDPDLDPKGYRFIFAGELAAKLYGDPLAEKALTGGTKYPETELMARLDSGQIDAIEAYAHEALARGVPFIEMPDEANLSNAGLTQLYASASYTTKFGKVYRGKPILIAVTVPARARNLGAAAEFVAFLLSQEGRTIIGRNGLVPVDPTARGEISALPAKLNQLLNWRQGLGR